jgi:hypothetical protein
VPRKALIAIKDRPVEVDGRALNGKNAEIICRSRMRKTADRCHAEPSSSCLQPSLHVIDFDRDGQLDARRLGEAIELSAIVDRALGQDEMLGGKFGKLDRRSASQPVAARGYKDGVETTERDQLKAGGFVWRHDGDG